MGSSNRSPAEATPDERVFLAASYVDVAEAEADYEALRQLYVDLGEAPGFEAVTIGRKASGEVRFHREPDRAEGSAADEHVAPSLAAGLAAAPFPSVAADIPVGRLREREILGTTAGVVAIALGRSGLSELGEHLDSSSAGLIAAAPAEQQDRIRAVLTNAHATIARVASGPDEHPSRDPRGAGVRTSRASRRLHDRQQQIESRHRTKGREGAEATATVARRRHVVMAPVEHAAKPELLALRYRPFDADVLGMPTSSWLMLLLAVTGAACNPIASDEAEPEVCREQEREVLVAEELKKDSASTPFMVDAGDDVWVGLITDSDYSPSALFSQVTGLYVIDKGDAVAYARDDLDFVVTDDSYIDFDREGQFVPFEFGPDSYQIWSIKTPEIAVVVCPPAND